MKRIQKIKIKLLVGCILLFIGLNGWARSRVDSMEWLKVSQNERWSLWVNSGTGLPQVRDGQSGFIWDSAPSGKEPLNDYWITAFNSPFVIQYLSKSGIVDTFFTGQANCLKQVTLGPSGAICTFRLNNAPLSFQVVYSLSPDGRMRVTIPFHGINDPRKGLLDIRVLPYFGSLPFQSRGYLVMPDGCGGLIKPNHPTKMYSASRIYGQRFSWDVNDRHNRFLKLPQNSFPNLPLFGVVKESHGLLGIISQGQFQAELGAEITPIIMQTAVSSRLIFREITYDMFGRLLASPLQDSRDRIVDYYFLPDPQATYVEIAKKYRELLLTSQRPLAQRAQPAPLKTEYRLRLFMGVNEQYLDTTQLISFTSFKEAEAMLRNLYQKGIRDLRVILVGWSNRGYLGDNPRHFPPDQQFGGTTGLKRLLKTGRSLGYSIGLEFDNSYSFKNSHGYRRSDTVKDFQGVPVDIGFGSQEYLFCPSKAWEQFLKSDWKVIRDLKVNGDILFEGLNQGLFDCFDKGHPMDHQAAASILTRAFGSISGTNPVAVNVAFDWTISKAAAVYDLPATCSEDCDETIPLTPLVFHGLVPYSFEPLNIRSDGRREFLKMVEYGAIPNAFLTAKSVVDLIYARYNPIFSGKYTDWRANLSKEYQIYQRDLRSLQTQTITDHQSPAKNVFLTDYDDGTKTIVNYGPSDYTYRSNSGAITVKALDYAIIHMK